MNSHQFLEQVEKHRNELYTYAYRHLWNRSDVEDVFSETVLVAFKNIRKFEDGTNFRAWLYKILCNKCFIANRESNRNSVDIDSIDKKLFAQHEDQKWERILNDPGFLSEQCDDEIVSALEKLSSKERSCLLLFSLEKFSYKEISTVTAIPVATVMTHLARGRAKMRQALITYVESRK